MKHRCQVCISFIHVGNYNIVLVNYWCSISAFKIGLTFVIKYIKMHRSILTSHELLHLLHQSVESSVYYQIFVYSPGLFNIWKEVQNCPSLEELRCYSFKLRCNFQVHLWLDIVTWFGVHKAQSRFCTSSLRWIAVNYYFSSRKLWCDRRTFQIWTLGTLYPS